MIGALERLQRVNHFVAVANSECPDPDELRSSVRSMRELCAPVVEYRDWVTVNGVHVFIGDDGYIEKGPAHFIGKKPEDIGKSPAHELRPGQTTEDAWRDPLTKEWNPDRAALHERIVDDMLEGHVAPTGRPPVAVILGGGTASGKTTASRAILGNDPNVLRVDPDEIKLTIPEYEGLKEIDPGHAALRVHEESSYLTKKVLATAMAKGLDITYDSTTSGKSGPTMAKVLADKGYDVKVTFVDVPLKTAIERAQWRAENSSDPINRGRFVPEDVIRESHVRAAANFQVLKDQPGLTSKQFYDTSERTPRLIYSREDNHEEKIYDQQRWKEYQEKAQTPI